MGNSSSKTKGPSESQMLSISQKTYFSLDEVQKLYLSYQRISQSKTEDQKIDVNEFASILGIPTIGFAHRIFAAFDSKPDQSLDFEEYCLGLSAISARSKLEEKAKFCFNVYDIDGNGTISRDELREVLNLSLNSNSCVQLSPQQLERIINNTIKEMDKNGDGEINFEEFLHQANSNPAILNCVKLDIDTLIK